MMTLGKDLTTLSEPNTSEVFEELRLQSEQLWRESAQLRQEAVVLRRRSEEIRRYGAD